MRDLNRIDKVCAAFAKAWKCFPDQRFGQFLYNYLGEICYKHDIFDIFFPEDDQWEEWWNEFAEEKKKK